MEKRKGERLYTLTQAKIELNKLKCKYEGHDYNIIIESPENEPVKLSCLCCGQAWDVKPTGESDESGPVAGTS